MFDSPLSYLGSKSQRVITRKWCHPSLYYNFSFTLDSAAAFTQVFELFQIVSETWCHLSMHFKLFLINLN